MSSVQLTPVSGQFQSLSGLFRGLMSQGSLSSSLISSDVLSDQEGSPLSMLSLLGGESKPEKRLQPLFPPQLFQNNLQQLYASVTLNPSNQLESVRIP